MCEKYTIVCTMHWISVDATNQLFCSVLYYTGASVKGEQLWSCTKRVIQELGVRGFFVQSVVSDMGGSNQAMWKCAGVVSNRYS